MKVFASEDAKADLHSRREGIAIEVLLPGTPSALTLRLAPGDEPRGRGRASGGGGVDVNRCVHEDFCETETRLCGKKEGGKDLIGSLRFGRRGARPLRWSTSSSPGIGKTLLQGVANLGRHGQLDVLR